MLGLKFRKSHKFKALDVMDRGSETQLQVAENVNFSVQCYGSRIIINIFTLSVPE